VPTRSRRLPLVLAAAAVGVVVLGVVLALVLGGGGDPQTTAAPTNNVVPSGGTATGASTTSTGATRPAGDTTVAVLNGTTVSGLAARTAEDLKGQGYDLGTVADAQDQNRSATLVQYAEGARDEALAVAREIGVGRDAVSTLDVNTRTVAGDDARVVVTVGADQNQPDQG
jgi:hypothetical protein